VPGRPSIVISDSYVHPVLGFRIGAEQYVVQNLGTDTAGALKMAVRIIRTGDNSIYRAAVRSVKCTPYPTQLVAAGNASGVLCFFAGYDQGIPGGYGDKVALLKLEDQNGKLVAKDLTGSSGLPWKGGVNGTPLSTFRTYKNYFGSGKYDGLSMMGGAWLDYNKDGLLDLITVGQHASIWAFKLVITSTKPEGISFTKTDVLTASNVSMTEFLTVSAFNEQDKSVMLPCVYITGEVDNLSAVKSYDVPDHARCFENGVWMVHKIPEGKAYSSTMQGASIKKDVTGRILALAPSFTHDSTGAHQPATPASNLFEINSSETCQVKIDSQLLNADKTAVIRSVSQTVSVTQGSSPRIGGWVDCNSTTHNAYFTNTTLVSGTSNITQLGWWTEANFLAHQSTFTAIQWKAATAFLAKPGVIKSLDIWNGCAKVNGRITATVVSCTAQEPIALADESSPFGQVLGAEAVSSEVVVNVITQIQKVIAQISALLQ
jgi:hypothetical protein